MMRRNARYNVWLFAGIFSALLTSWTAEVRSQEKAACLSTGLWQSMLSETQISGYLNAGYIGNTRGAHWNGNTGTGSHNGGALNAIYLSAAKTARNDLGRVDWGYGADLLFGEDSRYMRVGSGLDEYWYTGHDGRGNPCYGFAMPQLYVEAARNDWTVRAGHFYTSHGYEPCKASDRFFYTGGLSYDFLPCTHTGVLLSYGGFEKFDVTVGYVNGMDQGFSDDLGGALFLGSFAYHFSDALWTSYTLTAGDWADSFDSGVRNHTYGSLHSWIIEARAGERLTSVFTADYCNLTSDEIATTILGQHFYWTCDSHWKIGLRAEWQREETLDDAFERVSLTAGPNWTPWGERLILRPELRYDRDTAGGYGRDEEKTDQLCFAVDAVCKF